MFSLLFLRFLTLPGSALSLFSMIAERIATLYNYDMIRSFRHKGLELFYRTGSKAGIQPHHAKRLRAQLSALDVATCPEDMDFPAWRLHPLIGELSGFWAVTVNSNWRMIFRFRNEEPELIDYLDYH